jgi:hypothetical protein
MLTRPKEMAPFQMDLTFDTFQVVSGHFVPIRGILIV